MLTVENVQIDAVALISTLSCSQAFAFFIPAHQEEGAKFGQNISFSQFQIILYCIFWRLSEVGREREEKSNLSVAQCTMHSAQGASKTVNLQD